MDAQEPPPPPPRHSAFSFFLAVLAIGGSAIGVFVYQMLQGEKKPSLDASGFDVSQVSEQPKTAAAASSSSSTEPQSSMMAINTGMQGIHFGTKPGGTVSKVADGSGQPEGDFTKLCRKYESKVRNFTIAWTRQSPVLQRYGKEWMSYPDLKKLNDDYMRDHDPVAFMRGLARSKNFGTMVKEYAGQPAMQSFVKDAFKQAPSDLSNAAMSFANGDGVVKGLVDNVVQSLGLPPGLLGGGAGAQVDSGKIMDSMLNKNPQMQQAMQANPELQKQVQAVTPKQ